MDRFSKEIFESNILHEVTLDPYEQERKMDAWHNGTRGSAIKPMSDAKLEMNIDICRLKGYNNEANQLEREAKHRGLASAINPDSLSTVAKRMPMIKPCANVQATISASVANSNTNNQATQATGQTQNITQVNRNFTLGAADFYNYLFSETACCFGGNNSNWNRFLDYAVHINEVSIQAIEKIKKLLATIIIMMLLRSRGWINPSNNCISEAKLHAKSIDLPDCSRITDDEIKQTLSACMANQQCAVAIQGILQDYRDKRPKTESLHEGLSRSQMIAELKKLGKNYYFNKYTDQQIYNIYTKAKNNITKETDTKEETKQEIKRKKCNSCGAFLNDAGECPSCDLGDDDVLRESAEQGLPVVQTEYGQVVKLTLEEFDDEWATAVYENRNDGPKLFDLAMFYNGSIRHLLVALVLAVVLKWNCEQTVKTIINWNYGITDEQIGETIKFILKDREILSRINELSAKFKELGEDTKKVKDHKWVNKGKEGTHGTFTTKKAADAQRKAMFANGYHEGLNDINYDNSEDVDGQIECDYMDMCLNRDIDEDIEKHNTLNPKLWDNNELKEEVADKIMDIVNQFLLGLEDDEITIKLKDVILTGSNCSYNYTKDSDLDIHIVAETIDCPDDLYTKVYSAYRSLFNKNINISFYGIPVEIYVETSADPSISNGIYSVMDNKWIKEPDKDAIPEYDKGAFEKELKIWKDRYNKLMNGQEKKLDEWVNTQNTTFDFDSVDDDSDFDYYTVLKNAGYDNWDYDYWYDQIFIYGFDDYEMHDIQDVMNAWFTGAKNAGWKFINLIEKFDDDYRAKYYELDNKNLDYYIQGFGDDYEWVLTLFALYYHDEPGIYNIDISNRQMGTSVTGQVEITSDGQWIDKDLDFE